jgi:hypothetical protein
MSISGIKGELNVAGFIGGGNRLTDPITPNNGEKVSIVRFSGSVPPFALASVRLVWDFEGLAEEEIWDISGDKPMPFSKTVVGDGTKVLALVAENNDPDGHYFSGHVMFNRRLFSVRD